MATIKERGTIAVLGEVQSGTSQSGNPWYRQTIVVNVEGYRGSFRPIAVQASGKVVGDLEGAMVGDKVEISYEVTGREYQGRWYNNVDLYKVEFLEPQMAQPAAPAYPQFPQNPQYPQFPQQPVVQTQPAPAPVAPRRGRPAGQTTPQIPANTPMDLQQDDLPPAFYQ